MNAERIHGGQSEESRAAANRKIVNRLRRAPGQLAAVIATGEEDAPCRNTVQQLAAVSKAVDRAGYLLIANALTECLSHPQPHGSDGPEELEKLFLTLA